MRIENIEKVKARLSQIVRELPKEGLTIITRNGQPCAALVPITEDTDIEALALSQSPAFWDLYDQAVTGRDKEGWTRLDRCPSPDDDL